jgi:hypothetical protein
MTNKLLQLRQGDVLLQQVAALPANCTEIAPDGNRIVLAYGEATGHAHAIYDHVAQALITPGAADEIADAAIARAQSKSRIYAAANGNRFLAVPNAPYRCQDLKMTELTLLEETSWARLYDCSIGKVWFVKHLFDVSGEFMKGPDFEALSHEEHSFHATPLGIYQLPTQVEYTPAELRRVAD